MFQGTGKKQFHCRRCMLKDARRRFLNGEDFVRVQFREINVNSRSLSPHGYNNSFDNHTRDKAGIEQDNNIPEYSPTLEDGSMEINFSCERCLHHHQAYREREHLVEHPIAEPLVFDREEHRTRGSAPRKTRRASPKGIWTADSLRGLDTHSPSPMGGRWVLSPSQRLSEKWKEEHLSLRFSDPLLTNCIHCLQHHGFDTTKYKREAQPAQDRYTLGSNPPLIGSKGEVEAKEFSPKDNVGEFRQKENDVAWWASSEEERGPCRRCSSHHMNHEKLLNFNGETRKRATKNHISRAHQDGKRRERWMESSGSSPEFVTPTEEFSRSSTPTPQRSYNYRELYERKLQAEGASNTNNTLDLHSQQWNPSRKIPTHDIAVYIRQCQVPINKRKDDNNRAGHSNAWNLDKVKPSQKASPGASRGKFLQHHASEGITSAQPMMKHVKRTLDSRSKSPKWSKECLHKRELTRHKDERPIDRIAMTEKGRVRNGIKYEKLLAVKRTQSATRGEGQGSARQMMSPKFVRGRARARMVHKSQVVIKTPKFTKESDEVKRSTSRHQNDRRVMILEKKESRWAPPPNWTIGKVTMFKGVKKPSVASKKNLKNGEPLPRKTQDQKDNLYLKTISFKTSPKLSPSRVHSNETSSRSKGNDPLEDKVKRQVYSSHDENTNLDCKFEVISIETKELEERNPDRKPVSCRTQNSCPNPKRIFLRIPKCRQNNINDKDQKRDQKAPIHVPSTKPSTELKEKSAMSREKCDTDRDMKLRVEIRSELPLDVVDGRLKQFLKGVGGLIYYSPKDGGIPRIKELTNYFSGKQPLLWFSPRST